jgi:beta-phosphoglucomutase
MIKGIAFDLEGTVVDLEPAHHNAHLRVCHELGIDLTLEEAIEKIHHFIGGPDSIIAEEIFELSGERESPAWIVGRDAAYYKELLATMPIVPRDGFLEILDQCKKRGIKTAIGSLTEDNDARHILDASGLSKFFDTNTVVLKSHVKNLKPAPGVFIETAKRMGIEPSVQLVFEDSPRGIEAARKAQSRAIGMPVYDTPTVIAALRNAGAEEVFLHWRDIPIDRLLV